MSHLWAIPHDCGNEDDMDENVDRMGVVGSIERELLDVRCKIRNEKCSIPVFWCQTILKWPWQIIDGSAGSGGGVAGLAAR